MKRSFILIMLLCLGVAQVNDAQAMQKPKSPGASKILGALAIGAAPLFFAGMSVIGFKTAQNELNEISRMNERHDAWRRCVVVDDIEDRSFRNELTIQKRSAMIKYGLSAMSGALSGLLLGWVVIKSLKDLKKRYCH